MRFGKILSISLAAVLILALQPLPASAAAGPASGSTIACGGEHNLVIKSGGSLVSWGMNRHGQLGTGNGVTTLAPKEALTGAVSVSTAYGHTLAVKDDGSLQAWGWNFWGQVGDGGAIDVYTPTVIFESGVASAEAGYYRATQNGVETPGNFMSCSFAVMSDGSLYAWGSNALGQLGTGDFKDQLLPVKVMDNVTSVSAGNGVTFAIKTDGALWGWGRNSGQLPGVSVREQPVPMKIMDSVISVSAGFDTVFAVKSDGSLYAWGNNDLAQLGDGTFTARYEPVKILDGVSKVEAGGEHAFAIMTDGALWGWGHNDNGQLGTGDAKSQITPAKIMDAVADISACGDRSLAVSSGGRLYAWGVAANDDFGSGPNSNVRFSPLEIMTGVMTPSDAPEIQSRTGASDWAVSAVSGLGAMSLIPAGLNSDYQSNITRAEFAALMLGIYERKTEPVWSNANTFKDISGHLFFGEISKAYTAGIIAGVSETKFDPDAFLTREQAAKIVSETDAKIRSAAIPENGRPSYTDSASIAEWAAKYVAYAAETGLMQGVTGGRFDPGGSLTREQAMVIAYRAVK